MSEIEPKKVGRPCRFNAAVSSKIIELTKEGKTVDEISEILSIPRSTFYTWMRLNPEFSYTVKEARQVADELVEASLFRRAVGYSHPEHFVVKVGQHKTEIQTVEKMYPPDTASAIFWLKNRQPDRWRDAAPEAPPIQSINILNNIDPEVLALAIRTSKKKLSTPNE